MNKDTPPMLLFNCAENELLRLTTILQSGFVETGRQGDSILSFLLTLDGFTEAYIENKVQTIFYNGDALDDPEIKLGGESATIALGAAMPGLAGAIMKKGSICGTFRKSPTKFDIGRSGDPVAVRVKLFSTVARDRGPQLLRRGVRIDAQDLGYFLQMRPALVNGLTNIRFRDRTVSSEKLGELLSTCDHLLLKSQING